jgi:hypothetical protein
MKAASALFAWCISQGEGVSIVSPPPENRFHPLADTNFQVIESPILQGLYSSANIARIMEYHPPRCPMPETSAISSDRVTT